MLALLQRVLVAHFVSALATMSVVQGGQMHDMRLSISKSYVMAWS